MPVSSHHLFVVQSPLYQGTFSPGAMRLPKQYFSTGEERLWIGRGKSNIIVPVD